MTAAEISELVRESDAVFSTPNDWAQFYHEPTREGITLHSTVGWDGLLIDAENQICVAPAGMYLLQLQKKLLEAGHCLPFPHWETLDNAAQEGNVRFAAGMIDRLNIRQAIDLNLPHAAEGAFGNWRDWIIGMTVILGDGTIAKSGSQAVKNVAGYDAHKLFIGARGNLGIIAEVILRIHPATARPEPKIDWGPYRATGPVMIQRVLPTDYQKALDSAREDLVLGDPATATIWRRMGQVERFAHDWLIERGNLHLERSPLLTYYRRAKALLDPADKLNPGLLGIDIPAD